MKMKLSKVLLVIIVSCFVSTNVIGRSFTDTLQFPQEEKKIQYIDPISGITFRITRNTFDSVNTTIEIINTSSDTFGLLATFLDTRLDDNGCHFIFGLDYNDIMPEPVHAKSPLVMLPVSPNDSLVRTIEYPQCPSYDIYIVLCKNFSLLKQSLVKENLYSENGYIQDNRVLYYIAELIDRPTNFIEVMFKNIRSDRPFLSTIRVNSELGY